MMLKILDTGPSTVKKRLTQGLSFIVKRIVSMLYPARCSSCRQFVSEGSWVCAECYRELVFITDPRCACCSLPFEYHVPNASATQEAATLLCAECIQQPPLFAKASSILVYNDAAAKIIHSLKYQDNTHLATPLATWMMRMREEVLQHADYLIPVPMHRKRLFHRKYNQAALLAQALSKQCGIPTLLEALIRQHHTQSQAGLTRKQRLKNVRHATKIHPYYGQQVRNKYCVLIDDVMTTGATLQICTKLLLKAGAARVDIMTIARTVRYQA
jgi:ComF family protein